MLPTHIPHPAPSSPLPKSFTAKKARILAQLSVPAAKYDDASPKGSIDDGIRELIDGINAREGWVTTSSCAGRVAVFVEGVKRQNTKDGDGPIVDAEEVDRGDVGEYSVTDEEDDEPSRGNRQKIGKRLKLAAAGGKGGDGKWLFVSHEPVAMKGLQGGKCLELLGIIRRNEISGSLTEKRLIHFKFEPMILHVLTASLSHAQVILSAALQSGFRESGALNLTSPTGETPIPMVGVRSTGLALDSIIGHLSSDGEGICIVPNEYLEGLLAVANERFTENSRRIARFRDLLLGANPSPSDMEAGKKSRGNSWEDAWVRRERKRAEGLKRSQELRQRTIGESN